MDYGQGYAEDLTELVAEVRGWPVAGVTPIYGYINTQLESGDPASWMRLAVVTNATNLPNANKLALVWESVAGEVERGGPMGAADFLQGWVERMAADAAGIATTVGGEVWASGAPFRKVMSSPKLVAVLAGSAALAYLFIKSRR